jgi:hypothetical protein
MSYVVLTKSTSAWATAVVVVEACVRVRWTSFKPRGSENHFSSQSFWITPRQVSALGIDSWRSAVCIMFRFLSVQ